MSLVECCAMATMELGSSLISPAATDQRVLDTHDQQLSRSLLDAIFAVKIILKVALHISVVKLAEEE